jgi:hypothetical protein
MAENFFPLRVLYEDLPNRIELGIRVIHGEWSAVATAYTSPLFPREWQRTSTVGQGAY